MMVFRMVWLRRYRVGSESRGMIGECHCVGKRDSWEEKCCWTTVRVYCARSEVIVVP